MTLLPNLDAVGPSFSVEHLLLRECGAHPRELGELLRRARARYPHHPGVSNRLVLTDTVNAVWGQVVDKGYAERLPGGYVLTRAGELRLDYLYQTHVWKPYLKALRKTHGDAAVALAEQGYRA